MTPEWKDAFLYATKLSPRLGLEEAIAGSPVRPLQIQPDTSLGMFPFVQYHHRRSLAPFGGFSNPVVLCGNALPGLH